MARAYTLKRSPDSLAGVSASKQSAPSEKQEMRSSSRGAANAAPGLVICGISDRNQTPAPLTAEKNRFLKFIYDDAPVVGFRAMKNDVLTVRAARYPEELAARLEGCTRGEIEEFSMQSRRRLAIVAANTSVVFRSFVTVTYPAKFPADGKLVKRHLHSLMKALRRKLGRFSYLWFLEFQRRGAPHFHIFLSTALPEPLAEMNRKSGRIRKTVRVHWPWQKWISAVWYGIVDSGDEKHLRAGAAWEVIEKPDGAARYVAKESYKTFQKVVPKGYRNVGRLWGTSRDVPPDESPVTYASEDQMRGIFPPECFDAEGRPFPVMFAAAKSYENVIGTTADPAKLNAWKRRESHLTDLTLTSAFQSTEGTFKSGKHTTRSNGTRPTRTQIERREE